MSRNVEIVLGQFEAVNARDFAAAMDAYAEDVALTAHGRAEDSVIPLLGGGAIIVFTIVLIFLQNRLFLKQNRC